MTPTVLCRVAARSRIWRCERRLGAGERLKDAAFGGFGLWRPVGRGRLAQPEGGLLSVFHELDLDVVETACGAMLDGHEGLPVPAAQVEVTVSPGVQLTAAPQGLSRPRSAALASVVDEHDGGLEAALQIAQEAEDRGDVCDGVLVHAVQADQRVEDHEAWSDALHGLLQTATVVEMVEAEGVPRYGEMVAQAKALSGQEALPAHTQEVVTSWLEYHAGCQSICRQIRDWPARVDALTADCPEPSATLDSLRGWRQRAEPLLAEARAMPEKDGPHAPHLAAMPDERGALVEATSRLESALLAVEARETKLLAADMHRSADELHRDWKAHIGEATAARVDPFYLPGHEGLISRLQELRQHPAVEELPERERNQIDSILEQDTRQVEAISHVDNHLAEVQRCRSHLEHLKELAYTYRFDIQDVHSYDEWHDTAERLLAAGQAIVDDHGTYEPCLEHHPGAWSGVHAGIRELAAALGRDTTSLHHRQPELYLKPITRPLPDSQQTIDADASYRRLRDQWHEHVALAETSQVHPYQLPGHAPLIDAMAQLRDQPLLAAGARDALGTLLAHHADIQQAPADIDDYLKQTARAFQTLRNLEDTAQRFSSRGVTLEDMSVYADWKKHASDLADAGEAMLADRDRYSIHLDDHPDDAQRIRASVAHLNTALGRDDASISRERGQSLSEDEKTAEHHSQRRGIKP